MTVLDVDVEKTDADKYHRTWVKCQCNCGNQKSMRLCLLKNGGAKSCGCLRHANNLRKDLTGQKFGRLTVKRVKRPDEYLNGKRKRVEYFCDCDCGTKNHIVSSTHLIQGDVKSCGCYHKERTAETHFKDDLSGEKYGRLTVLRRVQDEKTLSWAYWLCSCECGNTKIVKTADLTTGNVQSCGCLISKNEEKIRKILVENNIKFKTQYSFSDLKNKQGSYPLRYDFAIFDNEDYLVMLIEFDGEQHFRETRFSSDPKKNIAKLRATQKNDKIKNQYCKDNGFSLFRIPYTYENEVEKLVIGALKEKGLIERND